MARSRFAWAVFRDLFGICFVMSLTLSIYLLIEEWLPKEFQNLGIWTGLLFVALAWPLARITWSILERIDDLCPPPISTSIVALMVILVFWLQVTFGAGGFLPDKFLTEYMAG